MFDAVSHSIYSAGQGVFMFPYVASPTGVKFHDCDSYVKMICGPYGSGKSCCCAMDVLYNACAQEPAPDGVRYSRVGVVRSTYPELISMTRKSLLEVLPPECGSITSAGAPLRGFYLIPLPDGTTVNLELHLLALANAEDCSKVLSANWSFCWINEATGVAAEVFTAITTRIGRYPSAAQGGVRWGGIMMDFNMPARGTWLAEYCQHPESNWTVFMQPPAATRITDADGKPLYEVNDKAENLWNLGSKEADDPEDFPAEERGKRYYRNQIQALLKNGREDVVMNMYCMLDVPIIEGKPVYSAFNRLRHVADHVLEPKPFSNVIVGIDQSGIHPAACVLQYIDGKWCVLDEIYAEGEGFEVFLHGMLIPLLRNRYATCTVVAAIDPSNQRDSWQAVTPRQRLEDVGIEAVTEYTNAPKSRIQAVEYMLNLDYGGLLVSPACELLIRGFVSEYRYRRLRASGTLGAPAYTPTPEKNDASHIHDALQYAALLVAQGDSTTLADTAVFSKKLSERRSALSRIL